MKHLAACIAVAIALSSIAIDASAFVSPRATVFQKPIWTGRYRLVSWRLDDGAPTMENQDVTVELRADGCVWTLDGSSSFSAYFVEAVSPGAVTFRDAETDERSTLIANPHGAQLVTIGDESIVTTTLERIDAP